MYSCIEQILARYTKGVLDTVYTNNKFYVDNKWATSPMVCTVVLNVLLCLIEGTNSTTLTLVFLILKQMS